VSSGKTRNQKKFKMPASSAGPADLRRGVYEKQRDQERRSQGSKPLSDVCHWRSNKDLGQPFIGHSVVVYPTSCAGATSACATSNVFSERAYAAAECLSYRRARRLRRHCDGPQRECIFRFLQESYSGHHRDRTRAHCLDGLILLTNCDKITPGMLMGVARLNIPGHSRLPRVPMYTGFYQNKRRSLVRDSFEAVGQFQAGKMSEKELTELEMAACPGAGRAKVL